MGGGGQSLRRTQNGSVGGDIIPRMQANAKRRVSKVAASETDKAMLLA
jgi:hypothetical protein